jgi:hypothetical protein
VAGNTRIMARSVSAPDEVEAGGWSSGGEPLSAVEHPILKALIGALLCAGPGAVDAGWRAVPGGAEIVQWQGLQRFRVRLLATPEEDALADLASTSPLVLDVLMVVVDRLMADWRSSRLVRCAEILEAKGRRRYGEEREVSTAQIRRELLRLGRLVVNDGERPVFSVSVSNDSRASFVVMLDPAVKAAWTAARPRLIDRRLLAFDHRVNRSADVLAKKLGLYVAMSGDGSAPLTRPVAGLLAAMGLAHELAGGRAGRVADRLEEALLRLQERGIVRASYRGGRELFGEDARLKGWVKRWLQAELVFRAVIAPPRPAALKLAQPSRGATWAD